MRDFAFRLERTYVYRRLIHRLRRLSNSIALSEAAAANVLDRGFLSTREIKLYLLNTMTANHFVPSFNFSTQCTPGVVCLLCYYPHLDRPALYFFAALSIVEGTRGVMLNFPGHPGIWSWDHLHERDTLSSEGERMAKITGYIRFWVRMVDT